MRHGGLQAVEGRERKEKGQGVVELRRAGPGSEVPAENILVLREPARVSSSRSNDDGGFTKTSDPARWP
jgi:hypothetical protein